MFDGGKSFCGRGACGIARVHSQAIARPVALACTHLNSIVPHLERPGLLGETLQKIGSGLEYVADPGTSPDTFSPTLYFDSLKTRTLGRVLLTTGRTTSTQSLLQDSLRSLPDGVVFVADRQTVGKGALGGWRLGRCLGDWSGDRRCPNSLLLPHSRARRQCVGVAGRVHDAVVIHAAVYARTAPSFPPIPRLTGGGGGGATRGSPLPSGRSRLGSFEARAGPVWDAGLTFLDMGRTRGCNEMKCFAELGPAHDRVPVPFLTYSLVYTTLPPKYRATRSACSSSGQMTSSPMA